MRQQAPRILSRAIQWSGVWHGRNDRPGSWIRFRMPNLSIDPNPPNWQQATRLVAFLLALVAGIYLGWKIYLAPPTAPDATASPLAATTPSPQPSPTVQVEPTGLAVSSLGSDVTIGASAPEFTLKDLGGQSRNLSDYRGSVVLVNFWASWCPPCRIEMPDLQQTYTRFKDQGLVVIGLNWTKVDDSTQVEPFVQGLGLTFPILLDPNGDVADNIYPLQGLPTSVIIDTNGTVRHVFIGPVPVQDLAGMIQPMLPTSPLSTAVSPTP